MAALIKGIPVTLYERTKTGEDAFHEPDNADTPVTDTHKWEGCAVEFFGKRWRVMNGVQQYITPLTPLDWDKKVQVERYE